MLAHRIDRGTVERGEEFNFVVVLLVVSDVATGHDQAVGKLLLSGDV